VSEGIQFPETRANAAEQLVDRYMALWNEPDAERRRPSSRARKLSPSEPTHGSTAAAGLNVLVLAADGRVQRNYTFVDGA
jgi:hypothetical protein